MEGDIHQATIHQDALDGHVKDSSYCPVMEWFRDWWYAMVAVLISHYDEFC
jgi:hypothetical protein